MALSPARGHKWEIATPSLDLIKNKTMGNKRLALRRYHGNIQTLFCFCSGLRVGLQSSICKAEIKPFLFLLLKLLHQ